VLTVNARNHFFGFRIPYYVWIGCAKQTKSSMNKLAALDAAVTESPFISALDLQRKSVGGARRGSSSERRSKAYESAIVNLSASLPLPAAWYQQHHWRIYYDEQLQKHKQFGDEYIYAFTWEDARVDARLLKITSEDVILASRVQATISSHTLLNNPNAFTLSILIPTKTIFSNSRSLLSLHSDTPTCGSYSVKASTMISAPS
jgi:hypothetical protein